MIYQKISFQKFFIKNLLDISVKLTPRIRS